MALPLETRIRLRLRKDRIWEELAAETTEANDRVRLRAVPMFVKDADYGDKLSVLTSTERPSWPPASRKMA